MSQDYSVSNRTPRQYESRVGLTISQSLLRGFGPAVNLARVGQAKRETIASQFELRAFTEQFIAAVERAFWKYALAREEIEIFEHTLTVAELSRDEIEQQINVGLLPPTEGVVIRAEVARRN